MNADKIHELANKIDAWAQASFPIHLPRWGVVEEVGELMHCFLKRAQGIRGFDDFDKFQKEAADAIGDITVYCLHDMAISGKSATCELNDLHEFNIESLEDVEEIMGLLAEEAAWLLQNQDFSADSVEIHEAILSRCRDIAFSLGLNYEEIVDKTWAHVSTRKGATNPNMETSR